MRKIVDEKNPVIYDTNKQKIGYQYQGTVKIYQGKGPDEKKKIRADNIVSIHRHINLLCN
jgi:hypothetical protein